MVTRKRKLTLGLKLFRVSFFIGLFFLSLLLLGALFVLVGMSPLANDSTIYQLYVMFPVMIINFILLVIIFMRFKIISSETPLFLVKLSITMLVLLYLSEAINYLFVHRFHLQELNFLTAFYVCFILYLKKSRRVASYYNNDCVDEILTSDTPVNINHIQKITFRPIIMGLFVDTGLSFACGIIIGILVHPNAILLMKESYFLQLFILGWGLFASMVGGFITSRYAIYLKMKHVFIFSLVNFVLSIFLSFFQLSGFPIWFTVVSIILVIPAVLFGGYIDAKYFKKSVYQ